MNPEIRSPEDYVRDYYEGIAPSDERLDRWRAMEREATPPQDQRRSGVLLHWPERFFKAAAIIFAVGAAVTAIALPKYLDYRETQQLALYDDAAKNAGRNAKLTFEVLYNDRGGDISGGYGNFNAMGALSRLHRGFEQVDSIIGRPPENYDDHGENDFTSVKNEPLSTFSIDVDTASYANVRRFLRNGMLPPIEAVRVEEMINYFPYDNPPPEDGPFAVYAEVANAPWSPDHRLVQISLKGQMFPEEIRPAAHLVFLIDVSGSMEDGPKLPLLKEGLELLTHELREEDFVSIVVYAGHSGLILPPTSGADKQTIIEALDLLQAGGYTNGGEGIRLAYRQAEEHFIEGGINRVVLATDGDFNVGITDRDELVQFVQRHAKNNIFLTVLGFGTGNLQDGRLEELADKGDGNYAYIDSLREAEKVLVRELSGTLHTIAKDVKIQVEFNPARVMSYRLIGYENRVMATEDFEDDRKDAGEVGAGHNVTALYEIVPRNDSDNGRKLVPLRYQNPAMLSDVAQGKEVLTVNIRYKEPDGYRSKFDAFAVEDDGNSFRQASEDFRFASAVALFGMLLKESPYAGTADWDDVLNIAADAIGTDEDGYRAEFIELVRQASAATDQLAAAVREAGETLSNLLQYDKHLTDDPNITFTFFAANNSGYTFTTQHAKSKKVFLFKD